MKKVPIDEVEPGDVAATDIKIHSDRPDVQYRIRIDRGRALTREDLNRLSREGVGHLFLRDPALDDLDPFVHDEEVSAAEEELALELRDIRHDVQSGANRTLSVKRLRKALDKLIEAVRTTEALMGFTSLKAHDDYTAKHSIDVAKLSVHLLLSHRQTLRQKLREESGASRKYTNKYMTEDLGLGAILHDVGKWTIPPEILNKSSALNDREWEAVETHPTSGHDILEDQERDFRAPVKIPALQHHEKFGGGGYPNELSGQEIHLYGRITAIADVYSALTSARPYRLQKTPNRAREAMETMQSRETHFDPELFELFKEVIPPFPIGQQVILSNGHRGVVCELRSDPEQPIVRVLHEGNDRLDEPYETQANTEDGPTIVN